MHRNFHFGIRILCCFILGDLHFAYAVPEDAKSGRIYKLTAYNRALDVTAGGSYTQLTVTRSEQIW